MQILWILFRFLIWEKKRRIWRKDLKYVIKILYSLPTFFKQSFFPYDDKVYVIFFVLCCCFLNKNSHTILLLLCHCSRSVYMKERRNLMPKPYRICTGMAQAKTFEAWLAGFAWFQIIEKVVYSLDFLKRRRITITFYIERLHYIR